MILTTTCNECKSEVKIDLGELNKEGKSSYDQAIDLIKNVDGLSLECPGFHVEIGGWAKRWNLLEALDNFFSQEEKEKSTSVHSLYVETEGEKREFTSIHHDDEFKAYIRDKRVYCNENNIPPDSIYLSIRELNAAKQLIMNYELKLTDIIA